MCVWVRESVCVGERERESVCVGEREREATTEENTTLARTDVIPGTITVAILTSCALNCCKTRVSPDLKINSIKPLAISMATDDSCMWNESRNWDYVANRESGLVECRFMSTEPVGLSGTGAQDGYLDFHTAPELWNRGYPPLTLFARHA